MDGRSSFAHQPALDGLRALAVAVVLLFHAEVPGFDGGYLGVSVFFTLSGYLITSLMLVEHEAAGQLSMGAFYARRVRRLVPASVLCLAAIVAISATTDTWDGVANLRGEIVGAALQVSNWVFLAGDGSYQQLFQSAAGARSPVEHFWSLSIEEQFYWVWPPVMVLLLSRSSSRRARITSLAVLTAVAAIAAPVTAAVFGPDAAYWATPARIAEILVGCLLAVLTAGSTVPRWAAHVGYAGLLALAVCVVTFPAVGGPAYNGWLPAVAVCSAGVVFGLQADSPIRSLLSTSPFTWLGRNSYGVYLYHWPIYLVIADVLVGSSKWLVVPVEIGVTLVVAQLSFVLVEQPIRRRRRAPRRRTFSLGAAATAAVVLATLAVVPATAGEFWEADPAAVAAASIDTGSPPELMVVVPSTLDAVTTTTTTSTTSPSDLTTASVASAPAPNASTSLAPATTVPPLPALSRPARIVVAGDSTAEALGSGLITWASEHRDLAQVETVTAPGCGLLRDGERDEGEWNEVPAFCADWLSDELPEAVAALDPDIVLLMVSTWDVVDHRWNGGAIVTPFDAEFADRLAADYRTVIGELIDDGAGRVVWVAPPIPRPLWSRAGTGQMDPARHVVVRSVVDTIVESRPDDVAVLDLSAWLDDSNLTDDKQVRPDGVHLDPDWSARIAGEFLGPQLVQLAVE